MSDSRQPTYTSLGIIPARGGSKGVPRKNIRLLDGKPLIAYSIEAAAESKLLTRFVTSTDDDEIAATAAALGCPVIMRPPEFSADDTPMTPAVESVVNAAERDGDKIDIIVLLQPTAPLRTGADVDAAIELLISSGAENIVSVYEVDDHHPSRMYTKEGDRLVPLLTGEPKNMLRQSLPPVYHRNGALYLTWCDGFTARRNLVGKDICPYIMPADRSANIDSELDLAFLNFFMSRHTATTPLRDPPATGQRFVPNLVI